MLNRKRQLDSLCHFKTSCVSAFVKTHNPNGGKKYVSWPGTNVTADDKKLEEVSESLPALLSTAFHCFALLRHRLFFEIKCQIQSPSALPVEFKTVL